MMDERCLRVGTRGSALARWQAEAVRAGLAGPSELTVVATAGDRQPDAPLGADNPAGFFTKEIERALLDGRVDLAVHSLKDLPIVQPPGLELAALLPRDAPADLLLLRPEALDAARDLPLLPGAVVGASSMRRQALLGALRPDLQPRAIRGNVPTRIDKCRRGDYDAVLLSRAGPERLRLEFAPLLGFDLNPECWPGSPGQAVVAVQARSDDAEARRRAAAIDCAATRRLVAAERALHAVFGGGCHAPFGAYASAGPAGFSLVVAAPDAEQRMRLERFVCAELDAAVEQASAWIRAARPPRASAPDEPRLSRAARPWR